VARLPPPVLQAAELPLLRRADPPQAGPLREPRLLEEEEVEVAAEEQAEEEEVAEEEM